MQNDKVKTREWVKTAAIIFLAVLLLLTFFSNTFMNLTLPQVASEQVMSGTINAKLRGSGTVSANESYELQISQTRKIHSVPVREGQQVKVGDVLLVLEAEDSEELKQAESELQTLRASYDKALIEAGNTASQNSYDVKQAQVAYDEAVAVYNQYSSTDPAELAAQLAAAEAELSELNAKKDKTDAELASLREESEYLEAKDTLSSTDGRLSALESEKDELEKTAPCRDTDVTDAQSIREKIDGITGSSAYQKAVARYDDAFAAFLKDCSDDLDIVRTCIENPEIMAKRVDAELIAEYTAAYEALEPYYYGKNCLAQLQLQLPFAELNDEIAEIEDEYEDAKDVVEDYEDEMDSLNKKSGSLKADITEQEARISDLSKASASAENVRTAQKALEDLLFRQSLGDSGSIDLRMQKQQLADLETEIAKLRERSDESEIKATVGGTVNSISVSAGSMANADTTLMKIDLTDRGYTLKICVTAEQAKKVKLGDSAELVNSWWDTDVTAVLERIENDPQNPSRSKLLVFRLDGDVEPDQNLTLSIGQKSANYDAIVPNSAVRSGSNGTVVLVLTVKSSPLGNRFTVTEVPVQVLAQDDTKSAISGVGAGEFVVTTSTEPLTNGQSVRQADEQS